MFLFHLIKQRQRMEQREITEVKDRDHEWQTSARDIVRVFSKHMRIKYRPMWVDEDSVRAMLETGHGCVPDAWRKILVRPITAEELKSHTSRVNTLGHCAGQCTGRYE